MVFTGLISAREFGSCGPLRGTLVHLFALSLLPLRLRTGAVYHILRGGDGLSKEALVHEQRCEGSCLRPHLSARLCSEAGSYATVLVAEDEEEFKENALF
jgi:hypothetical protein